MDADVGGEIRRSLGAVKTLITSLRPISLAFPFPYYTFAWRAGKSMWNSRPVLFVR